MPRARHPFRLLALIPARRGSKGLRHKNVKKLAGVPLLVRAVELARACARRGEEWSVVVSTDSPHYARLARRAGAEVPFLRPARLASDGSRLIDAVLHAVEQLDRPAGRFDAVLLLAPTCPLRTVRDVRRAIGLFRHSGGESVATVTADPHADSWRFALVDGKLDRPPRQRHVGRRQEARGQVVLNGAVYVATPDWLRRHRQFVIPGRAQGLVMPVERSIDVDSPFDFWLAEQLWAQTPRPRGSG